MTGSGQLTGSGPAETIIGRHIGTNKIKSLYRVRNTLLSNASLRKGRGSFRQCKSESLVGHDIKQLPISRAARYIPRLFSGNRAPTQLFEVLAGLRFPLFSCAAELGRQASFSAFGSLRNPMTVFKSSTSNWPRLTNKRGRRHFCSDRVTVIETDAPQFTPPIHQVPKLTDRSFPVSAAEGNLLARDQRRRLFSNWRQTTARISSCSRHISPPDTIPPEMPI